MTLKTRTIAHIIGVLSGLLLVVSAGPGLSLAAVGTAVAASAPAAVSTAALAVASTATTATVAVAPVAAAVAEIPVLGTAATTVASVALESVGLGGRQAISNAQNTLSPPGALGGSKPTTFEEGAVFQRFGSPAGFHGAPVGQ